MNKAMRIFVADYVPLANKGEEAIIRGIEDLLGQARPVEIGLFGPASSVLRHGNITIFPRDWVYRVSGSSLSARKRMLRLVAISALMRCRGYGRLRNLTGRGGCKYSALHEFFNSADYVLVGHDAVFGPESCGVIHLARKKGKRVGILGAGVSRYSRIAPLIEPLYRRAVDESDFCIFRERSAQEYMRDISRDPEKVQLAPDPAFAMNPAPPEDVQSLLDSKEWYGRASGQRKLLVGATVCQKSVLLRGSFTEATDFAEKRRLHCLYLASIFDAVIRERNAFFLFLPHSIEKGERNDVKTAREVAEAMTAPSDSFVVLEDDLGARMLKGIIRECDFLVGQRAHSLIGSAAVATPFVGLVSSNDRRTHDILGEMCGCESQLIDMDTRDAAGAQAETISAIDRRERIRLGLMETMAAFKVRLAEVAAVVIGGS